MGIDHTQRRKAGNIGEDAVCGFLVRHGYEIIKRNFTVRGGEIDIIAEMADLFYNLTGIINAAVIISQLYDRHSDRPFCLRLLFIFFRDDHADIFFIETMF